MQAKAAFEHFVHGLIPAPTLAYNPVNSHHDSGAVRTMQSDVSMAGLAYDRVVNAAAAQGIRIYTVEARGLVTLFNTVPSSMALSRTRAVPTSSRDRVNDTQRTLRDMAGETGGHAFLNGVSSGKMSRTVLPM